MAKLIPDPDSKQTLCCSDIAELRDEMDCSMLDLFFILGRMPPQLPIGKGEKGNLPVTSLPVSYLTRLLREAPELGVSLLPQWPNHEEAFNAVASVWDEEKYGRLFARKFATLCGVTSWTYAKWVSGENAPTALTLRLFHFLCCLIKLRGKEGFDLYLRCLDEDAKSRGLSGFKELMRLPDKKEKMDTSSD